MDGDTTSSSEVEGNSSLPQVTGDTESATTPPIPELPSRWDSGTPLKNVLPQRIDGSHWESCYHHIDEHDRTMCRVWQEEIDKLLIFAGLFSAAVTAFVIESYQWLQDPRDINTDLLAQLVALQLNGSAVSAPAPAPFAPSTSAIRINIFWFTSLTLSLGGVLVGILCLQWLREYQRPVSKGSFKDKLSYRQTRYEGIMAWRVPQIVSALPILLQVSVVLFFAGIFDLLWDRNHVVAKVVLVPIATTTIFLLSSSILPAVQMISLHFFWESTITTFKQCPYKSPQSWLICRFALSMLGVLRIRRHKDTWSHLMETFSHRSWITLDQFWNSNSWDDPASLSTLKYPTMITNNNQALANVICWMQDNFPRNSDITYYLYQCLPDLDSGTLDVVLDGIYKHDNNTDISLSEVRGQGLSYRELASAVFLKAFHWYLPSVLEHWIRAVNSEPNLLLYLPIARLSELPRDKQDVFFPQFMLCICSIFEQKQGMVNSETVQKALDFLFMISGDMSPQTRTLLELNINAIKGWMYNPVANLSVSDTIENARILTQWMNVFSFHWISKFESLQARALVIELAWAIGKRNEELKAAHSILPEQLHPRWLSFFHVPTWESTLTTPNSGLWWTIYLSTDQQATM